jgi:uncharacterized protein YggT (Ycf19 family)
MRIIRSIIAIIFGAIELLLGLRFIFELISASARAPFIGWLYSTTDSLVTPFYGIIPNLRIAGFVINFSTLIALIIFIIIGEFLMMIFSASGHERLGSL